MTEGARDPAAAPTKRAAARRVRNAAIAAGAVVLAIGVAHAPFARSFLQRIGGCPMAGSRMTSSEMDAARRLAVSGHVELGVAPARPALGFTLDVTTLDDVHRWAERARVDCDDVHDGLVQCAHVAPASLGLAASESPIDDLALGFDVHRRLVNVTTLRSHLGAATAASSARAILDGLGSRLGPATGGTGAFDGAHLGLPGAYSLATARYRYVDYVAEVTAMNVGEDGPSVREHYMSARD